MINVIKAFIVKNVTRTISLIAIILTFVPEIFFDKRIIKSDLTVESNIVLNRIILFFFLLLIISVIDGIYISCREKIIIKGHNYSINIEYSDIIAISEYKKVITFDECFTTHIGDMPGDIKSGSICGQYLIKNSLQDTDKINKLITDLGIQPCKTKSKYKDLTRYESGTLVPNGKNLLMSFAKLDENGLGVMTYDEFINCLNLLWKEIDKYYALEDVCIPILGSGILRLKDKSLTQQELLDIIVSSYKLSPYKLKTPNKLHIVCKKREGFSINKVGYTL